VLCRIIAPAIEDNPAEPFWAKRCYDFVDLVRNIIGLVSAGVWKCSGRQNGRLFLKMSKYWTKSTGFPKVGLALT
jgi:hypothetical protein